MFVELSYFTKVSLTIRYPTTKSLKKNRKLIHTSERNRNDQQQSTQKPNPKPLIHSPVVVSWGTPIPRAWRDPARTARRTPFHSRESNLWPPTHMGIEWDNQTPRTAPHYLYRSPTTCHDATCGCHGNASRHTGTNNK